MRKDIQAINEAFRKVIRENTQPSRNFGNEDDDAEEKLLNLLQQDGVVDIAEFDTLAIEVLAKHGFQQSDIENMDKDDIRAEIADLFGMELEEEGDKVMLIGYGHIGNKMGPKTASEDAEDIKSTPADPNASWNPRDWDNKEPRDNKSMTVGEQAKHDKAFYSFWENVVDRMPDDVLESTMYMIKNFNALNKLVKEEYAYRTQSFEA